MAPASPSANPKFDRNESQASTGDILRRGTAPAGSTDGAPQKSDFPVSLGKPKSTRVQLGLKDRLIFWVLIAVLHAFSLLPDFILYRLGIACGLIFHRFDHRHRKIGIRNLEIAFPEKSVAERNRILRASYINLGRCGAEYVRLGGFFYRRLGRRITYNRLDVWNELHPRYPGKGALILTAHFGGFELLPAGHALHGFQIGLVHHTQRFLAGDDLVSFIRERAGVQVIRKHTAAREMLRSLKRGEIIGIPLDQNAKRSEAIWVPFFCELAATPSGFDRLAMMAGAPVVPVFIVRQPDGISHVIEIYEEIPQHRTGDRNADALVNTARYQRAIEEMVRKYPDQWLWTHRRYRTRPVRGTPSLYD
ncbi:lysophospholipid acyltransferase family protein [Candidatus Binatus sp.]|uniref:lysophospholipid acyltransferase family protein n=1 Tax=Candidatus Binatus sp. TaxID=2811406 RepID=UPI003BAE5A2A